MTSRAALRLNYQSADDVYIAAQSTDRTKLDNRYSSLELYQALLQQQTHATETVRLNRKKIPRNFPGQCLKKGERTFLTADGIMALVWKDKRTLLSSK